MRDETMQWASDADGVGVLQDQPEVPSRPDTQATQADVARLAGVSTAVVSYVLNNGPRPVAPETRKRVQAAIGHLGYRPDARAQSLRHRRHRVLGLVVPDVGHPYHTQLAQEVELAARARGYAVVLCSGRRDEATERTYVDVLLEHRVAGVLVTGMTRQGAAWQEFVRWGVPLVFVNSGPRPGFVTVGYDAGRWMGELVKHLVYVHRHRRIGYVGPAGPASTRRAGYLAAVEAARVCPDPRWIADIGNDATAGYEGLTQILEGTPDAQRPTAVVTYNDLLALGVIRCAVDRGLRVPVDLAVASHDNIPLAAFAVPSLTTVAHDMRGQAVAAVEALLARLEAGTDQRDPSRRGAAADRGSHVVVPAQIMFRESCGCANSPADSRRIAPSDNAPAPASPPVGTGLTGQHGGGGSGGVSAEGGALLGPLDLVSPWADL